MGNPPIPLATGFPNEVNGMPTIDRSAGNGDLIGDPPEGALVAKGGIDAATTRRAYPRIAELPIRCRLQADGHLPPDDRRRAR